MEFNVLTRCTRPEHLRKVQESLKITDDNPEREWTTIRWKIIFDTSVVKNIDSKILSDLSSYDDGHLFTEFVFWEGESGDFGHCLLNRAIDEVEDDEDLSSITYERKATSEIKPSLFTRLFFKKGELKILSFRGVLLMILLMLSFLVDIFIAIFSLLVILLLSDLPRFKLWQVMLFVAFIPVAYLNWRYFFMPLYRLPYYRVVKAPMFFANINVVNADIEMYWDKDKEEIVRG